jgi:UDP-galactopyranose mutase
MHPPGSHPTSGADPAHDRRTALPPLFVFSHLRWGFVYQRPQHLLTRLARDFQVFFFEEPVYNDAEPYLASSEPAPGVEVLTPHTRVRMPGFHDDQLATLETLVAEFAAERAIAEPFVWLYTPMALPLVSDLEPRAVIYDCMDDLASFKFAPRQLGQREDALMKLADIVLTGGPSLHEKRKGLHANIHCLPSAVDAGHFSPAHLQPHTLECAAARALHEGMPHPRLGFFGVIDERLDLDIVAGIADQRPDWQITMVGPVVKIDPSSLPQRPNIRWLGMQSYDMLPYLQSHWDVCLLPFALNESTRFISPTKTLEYLAGGKPVVSTPILDVQSLYGEVVRIAADATGFVEAAEAAMREPADHRAVRLAAAQALVDGCTWDGTAARIRTLMMEFVRVPTLRHVVGVALPPAGDAPFHGDAPPLPAQELVAGATALSPRPAVPAGG